MLESNLVAGNQKLNNNPLKYGQSVTDACLDFDDTVDLLQKLAGSLSD
jgi:3-deoxy-7-phosphoheptulonate synthase